MAHIKSTMEMVLARADRLCAESPATPPDEIIQQGMKSGAALIQGDSSSIASALTALTSDDHSLFITGILRTIFRHIQLPREEGQPWAPALSALQVLSQSLPLPGESHPQLAELLNELGSILGRYHQHRLQLEKQLEENFSLQAAQLQQSLAQQTGMKMKITPRQHPKFMEEWQRVQSQLNDQYSRALDQFKSHISMLFGLPEV